MAVVRERIRMPDAGRDDLQRATRVLLLAFITLTLVATNQLFVLARHTATLFSWTIQPPLSAAFLGASYFAGCVLSVLALRSRSWATARVPLVTVLVFAVPTLLHLDRFHFAAPGLVARAAAWIWLGVYLVVPVVLLVVVLRQSRHAGPAGPAGVTMPHLAEGRRLNGRLDGQLMLPVNTWLTHRFLPRARSEAWHNGLALAAARREGPAAYADRLHDLDTLASAKVGELLEPRWALVRATLRGFGVTLPPA